MPSNLSPNQLFKYDWRVKTFLNKYKAGDHFELVNGQKVQLIFEESVYHAIENKNNFSNLKLTDGQNIYSLSNFKKTYEFGGKPDGTHAGVKVEEQEIVSINEQLEALKRQTERCSIPIHIRDGTISVARCIKTTGTPKSDFTLLNENDFEVGWISHKKGSTCTDFQNWSGMTQKEIRDHTETQEFISDVKNLYNELPKTMTIAKPIKSLDLQKLAVYGIEYKKLYKNSNNVTMVLQGPITILPFSDVWQLSANQVHYNGDTLKDDYEPVFMAIYKGDRNNFNIKGARFSIQSKGSRNVKIWLS